MTWVTDLVVPMYLMTVYALSNVLSSFSGRSPSSMKAATPLPYSFSRLNSSHDIP